jgi:putative tryptophan/tyrosine transport system substrate-binding protein
MRRREFFKLVGGATAVWPFSVRAQQLDRMRRIGVLMNLAEGHSEGQARIAAFIQGLQQLGWTESRNVRIDTVFSVGSGAETRKSVAELVARAPDVILATGSVSVGPLLQVSGVVPIVFVIVPDPVGAGYVKSLARPGGNATGFSLYEYGIGGKWLELLKQIAPGLTRVAVIRDPAISGGLGVFGAIQSAAPAFGVEATAVNVRDASEIESDIAAFARNSSGGLIVTASGLANTHRSLIIALAARHKLPAIYFQHLFVADGGLISYGPNYLDQYRLAAGYVDRILKGEKPADMPVQAPTKYELVINIKTAKALGITVPPSLLARADEVIE